MKRWQERQKGIRWSDKREDCLTNLRFADDVPLFSTSLSKLEEMLCDFIRSTESVGSEIHPSRTKILSNQNSVKKREVTIDNIKIDVLQKKRECTISGTTITFEEQETTEIKNRLKAAWAAFHKYRQELTSRSYRLCHRLRLFNMVITPTWTYASGTWTLSKTNGRVIKCAQRKMLRLIVQTKRRYKTKKKKETKKEPREGEERQKMTLFVLSTKRQDKARTRAQVATWTVMYPSMKTKMKRLTNVKQKKVGSNSSVGVRKKRENI